MNLDHVHFYVEDALAWRRWFVHQLGFQPIDSLPNSDTQTEIVQSGSVCILLSSAKTSESPVAQYLKAHPAGIADVAFQVANLEIALTRASAAGAQLVQSPRLLQRGQEFFNIAQIQGWGDLRHTLVESVGSPKSQQRTTPYITGFDHAVLNVQTGELDHAIAWYEKTLGFQPRQSFEIQTDRSALCSQVMVHPEGTAQFPINQPASASSQIQEFLDWNRGGGIQHIALQTGDILEAIAYLRQQGLEFLPVPFSYYEQLRQRPGFNLSELEWQAIARQEVLVDWQTETPQALLLQAFTQPIFAEPTFFFELIERRQGWKNQQRYQAQGFGEGNFRALFEAIEREQLKRGSLR
ncbi:MAG TPA: 4-hydroxyphenylpyruvate dioxygenase [Coleofasciculaceae cyanobacterium]